MIPIHTRKAFDAAIIAQDDDNDYSESGWLAVVVGDQAALTRYSHCSCYGTWESLNDGGISDHFDDEEDAKSQITRNPRWDWTGSVADLVTLAKRNGDPFIPGRETDPDDYDGDHLLEVYKQILAWDKQRQAVPS